MSTGLLRIVGRCFIMAKHKIFSWTRKVPITHNGKQIHLIHRPVPGYDRYEATVTGLIYDTYLNKYLNHHKTRDRFPYYCVSGNFLVHRLVAMAWVDNPLELSEVNHIDGNTANNWSNNLEWCTRKYNVQDAYRRRKIKRSNCGQLIVDCL